MAAVHQYTLKLVGIPGATPLIGTPSEVGGTNLGIDTSIAPNVTNQAYAIAFALAGIRAIFLLADKPLTIKVNGTDAVQTFTASGTVSGGTWTATFGGQTASGLAWNISAGALQTALRALTSVGTGNITCTGGPLPGTPIVAEFTGSLGLGPQSTITTSSAGLTGGGTIGCASTTTGVAPTDTKALVAGDPFIWRASPGYFAVPLAADVAKFSFTTGTQATNLQGFILLP